MYCRMLQGEQSSILLTFIKLPFVVKIFVLSIFEWPFYTGFTVGDNNQNLMNIAILFCIIKLVFLVTVLPAKSDSDVMFCLQL